MSEDRMLKGVCVNCGGPLIQPNSWHCCSSCVPLLREKILKARKDMGKNQKVLRVVLGKK